MMNPLVIEVTSGSESSMNEGQREQEVNLDKMADNVSEAFIDILECPSTDCMSKIHKQPKLVASSNTASMTSVIGDVRLYPCLLLIVFSISRHSFDWKRNLFDSGRGFENQSSDVGREKHGTGDGDI